MVEAAVCWRYAFSKSNNHRSASITIMIGIAIGTIALLLMAGLLGVLQFDVLDAMRTIESFHLQLTVDASSSKDPQQIVALIKSFDEVTHVYPYADAQLIVQLERNNRSQTARLRYVDPAYLQEENPFTTNARLLAGTYPESLEIAMGSHLAASIDAHLGDQLRITYLGEGQSAVLSAAVQTVTVAGLFATDVDQFNRTTVLTTSSQIGLRIGSKRLVYGIYVSPKALGHTAKLAKDLQQSIPGSTVISWQEANRALYSALLLEKMLMYLFLLFMFIILGVHMKHASLRLLQAKKRELAILRALGMSKKSLYVITIGQNMVVTVLGLLLGVVAAFVLAHFISPLFRGIDTLYMPSACAIGPCFTILLS